MNRRAILSYPPFIFSDVAAQGIKDTRYSQSYRPDGGLGCGGASVRVNFTSAKVGEQAKSNGKKAKP